jgi:hypothetical protein
MTENIKNQSKKNWLPESQNATIEEIKVGALQRIADSTEAMAANYIKMQDDLERYRAMFKVKNEQISRLYRRISALQGVITRMKRRAKNG